jgi:7-carboxy-7-deazaguanine synthase
MRSELMAKKKVNEIFYSLQGEGFHTGTPAVFVRFSGCDLHCPFCDTQHETGVMMRDEEIVSAACRWPATMVVLTGGEPSLWVDEPLLTLLHGAGKYVTIETNGTRPLPAGIDWVTCSPKEGAEVVLEHIDELKVVYQGQSLEPYERFATSRRFLQPCSKKNVAETIECVKRNPAWRLSLQTQLLVGIR